MIETASDGQGEARPVGVQADLWGQRADDWADVLEGWNGWGVPIYRRVLERAPVVPGSRVLDVGCGAGRFLRMARDRGADVSGIDATPRFVEIAKERVLDGDFRVGNMEALPWEDDSFDLVTGFNSFFIADDMRAALTEARRVARPGATVALSVFGRPERCDSTSMFAAVRQLVTGELSSDAEGGPGLHDEGVLEEVVSAAGLSVVEAEYFGFDEVYPDIETMLRGLTAPPPMRRAAEATSEEGVREAITTVFRDRISPGGRVGLREELRYALARA